MDHLVFLEEHLVIFFEQQGTPGGKRTQGTRTDHKT